MSKGWGFKIDYDASIKDDQAWIARSETCIKNRWFAREDLGVQPLIHILFLNPALGAPLGLSAEQIKFALAYEEWQSSGIESLDPNTLPADGSWRTIGREAYKVISTAVTDAHLIGTETRIREELRGAKAALARHLRNKKKYEG